MSNEDERDEQEPQPQNKVLEVLPRQNNMIKERCPAVQVSEKQISNKFLYNSMHRSNDNRDKKMTSTSIPTVNKKIFRQAATKAEHVVVRGSKSGDDSFRRIINFDEEFQLVLETVEEGTGEHFQDPPNGRNPLDPDVMDNDVVYMQSDGEADSNGLVHGN